VYPVYLAMVATHLKNNGSYVVWDAKYNDYDEGIDTLVENDSQVAVPFLDLPAPDRVFTDAKNPRWQSYGNYKYHPATHMMSALGCLHGKCSFCYENDRKYEVRHPFMVASEVRNCVELGFKEIFDDAATLPDNHWMIDFIKGMGYCNVLGKIVLGCNLRINSDNDFSLMKKAGYRMVLFGVESASQGTLDRINKGIKAKDIIPTIKRASNAGLEPHITVMFGYPWETHKEAMLTVDLVHALLKKGYAKTAQASIFSPPRTAPDKDSPSYEYIRKTYDIYKSPEFWWRKLSEIREWADIKYLIRSGRLVFTEKYKPSSK
jgi:anaerobic magnesium-protoporphyrin IX monomethyl ester cyclase